MMIGRLLVTVAALMFVACAHTGNTPAQDRTYAAWEKCQAEGRDARGNVKLERVDSDGRPQFWMTQAGTAGWEEVRKCMTEQFAKMPLPPFGPPTVVKGDDGAEMVLVPAGEFWMGSEEREIEKPRRRVYLDGFYIDKYEVANNQFQRFVEATRYRTTAESGGRAVVREPGTVGTRGWAHVNGATWRTPTGPGSSAKPDHPVVQVSWHDAVAYCKWLDKRLPTEAEWEKAARGPDGRRYPWGNYFDETKANGDMLVKSTTPVGSYPAGVSPYGVHDMAGNVWEWVADWYDEDYYKRGPERNPPGPNTGESRSVRGGSWDQPAAILRSAVRGLGTPSNSLLFVGFRCAKDAPK